VVITVQVLRKKIKLVLIARVVNKQNIIILFSLPQDFSAQPFLS
jgi:hypothetical protein